MTIEEYTTVILPVLLSSLENTGIKSHVHFLSGQSFYGYIDYISPAHRLASRKALETYKGLGHAGNLAWMTWRDQRRIDRCRRIFQQENVYTARMFQDYLKAAYVNKELSVENICAHIAENYYVAWVLTSEAALLPRIRRGTTLKEAFEIYRCAGIELIR